jgi:small subunit ribosomal protein S9
LTDEQPDQPDQPEAGTPPTDEPAAPQTEGQSDQQSAPAGSSSDEVPTDESPAEEPVADSAPAAESESPAPEEPAPEPEAAAEEPAPEPAAAAEEAEPEAPAAEPSGAAAEGADSGADEAPRAKPEIPGADLELIMPEQEAQYLDAEALAAAEAEAEAEAARRQAEAEDIHSKPIADAAIDLAAGARYTATGKRKTAVARVILKPGKGTYLINGKELNEFFPRDTLQRMIRQPLESVGYEARMDVVARMHGGGVSSQAGALRHGISRALIVADPNLRGELKRRGFLTRDPRVKERKKAGLKKARKRPQFSKR